MTRRSARAGYTLVELAIVVAIIAILAAIAIPQFSDMLSRSTDGATLGNLGAMRTALSIYYGDTEGASPASITALVPKYLNRIPNAKLAAHQ